MRFGVWPGVAIVTLLLVAVRCKESSNSGGGTSLSPDEALCKDYCSQTKQAGCGGCAIGCDTIIESVGGCIDSWRALTQCMVEGGVMCADGGVYPKQNGCLDLIQQHAGCLGSLADAGTN